MKRLTFATGIAIFLMAMSCSSHSDWTDLIDKDLSLWRPYQSYTGDFRQGRRPVDALCSGPVEGFFGKYVADPEGEWHAICPHGSWSYCAAEDFGSPYGAIRIRHEKKADGSIATSVSAPEEIKLLM